MANYEEIIGKTQIEGHSTQQLACTFEYEYGLHIRLWDYITIFLNLNKNECNSVWIEIYTCYTQAHNSCLMLCPEW